MGTIGIFIIVLLILLLISSALYLIKYLKNK